MSYANAWRAGLTAHLADNVTGGDIVKVAVCVPVCVFVCVVVADRVGN
eukprot:gene12146-biopygen2396